MMTNKIRFLVGALLTAGLLATSTPAHARPEPIPPPVATPAPEASPGTGQLAPEDPESPPLIEPPIGLSCIAGGDQSDCDPGHSGDALGNKPGNKPGDAWYDDMALQMYSLQEDLYKLSDYGAKHDPYIEYYAKWLTAVTQQYYSLGYKDGNPRHYAYGKMTRGDYNYYYYYWVRPIYFSLLYYSARYYETYRDYEGIHAYQSLISHVSSSYHKLVLCNYGFNGDDAESREDLSAKLAERAAGVRP